MMHRSLLVLLVGLAAGGCQGTRPGATMTAIMAPVGVAGSAQADPGTGVLCGPVSDPIIHIPPPGDKSPPLMLEAGFAVTFRPVSWPLGRTRRIIAGTPVERRDHCPPDVRLYVVFYADPDSKVERIFLMNFDREVDDRCKAQQFSFKDDSDREVRATIGQFVESTPDALTVRNIREPTGTEDFLLRVKRTAEARGFPWKDAPP